MIIIHSPGPWKAGGYLGALNREVLAADGRLVCAVKVKRYDDVSLPVPTLEGEANLRLVLAAPEMLEELTLVVEGWDAIENNKIRQLSDWEKERRIFARAVIAKVKGEAP